MTSTMRDRVRLALDLAPGAVPPRFEAAYRRGGTPTSVHLAILAEAASTSPRWLMTGQPEEHAPRRKPAMPKQTAAERLQADLLASLDQFQRERRAEILAAGGDPDEDRDPLELVRAIADNYAAHRDLPDAEAMYDELALELSLHDVRALRLAAEAAAVITPRLIRSARENGQPVASIAADLAVTESYVYRILREKPAADQ